MLSSRPSPFDRPQRGPFSARFWLILAVLILLGGLLGLAWRVPADRLEAQNSNVVERCTTAFSAHQFAAASQLLGLPIMEGSFKVLPSTVRASTGQDGSKVWKASVPANLVAGGRERLPVFTCLASARGVSFRLQPTPPAAGPIQ
ncbi:hypothetical protein EHF33_15290 [Deinococcus psychrotolerans]|uniref:Uncharacterized protein n=1 Tax=Deinococcus psychrotolerans TaxID=2489213 RepID=A0A3G8YNR4_9DEIO|nr:hypothetical protein [Deinococcus psychrotolerans]AZI44254.1 hypothetical protein EHF33_15290 [Deinococcus psychrotolerans]